MKHKLKWLKIEKKYEFEKHRLAFEKLCKRVSDDYLFTSSPWCDLWLDIFWQSNWKLQCFIAYEQDELVAFAPFYLQLPEKWFQLSKLYPLGQGETETAEITSEYNDVLVFPGYEEQVILKLAEKIKKLKIDQIYWRAAMDNSHINKILQSAFNCTIKPNHARYIIECSNWSLEKLSKNTRSRYKRSLNQLNKINAKLCWLNPEQYEEYTSRLINFHQSRWRNKDKFGAFAHKDFQLFHQKLRNHDNSSLIKMSAIMVNDKPIAINYYLFNNSTLYFYQCGWDEENYAKLSPGLALHLWSIEHCTHQYYDFMMGGLNDSYKAKFGGKKIPMTNININLSPWKVIFQKILTKLNF